MNERWLVSSFTASSLIHLGIIPLAALVMHAKPIKPAMVPIELVDVARVEEPKKVEVPPPPPPPAPKPKLQNITAPKLLSKPVFETSPLPPTGNTKEEIKEKPVEQPLASLPDNSGAAKAGWNVGRARRRSRRQRRRRRQSFWQRRRGRGRRQRRRQAAAAEKARRDWARRQGRRHRRRRGLRRSAFGPGSASRRLSSQAALSRVGQKSGRAGSNNITRPSFGKRPGRRSGRRPVRRISRSRFRRHGSSQKMALRAGAPGQRRGVGLGHVAGEVRTALGETMGKTLVNFATNKRPHRACRPLPAAKSRASRAITYFKATARSSSCTKRRNTTCASPETASLF